MGFRVAQWGLIRAGNFRGWLQALRRNGCTLLGKGGPLVQEVK